MEREHLIDDLSRLQVPNEPHLTCQTEGAGQGAPHLSGKTGGQPPLIRNQYRLERSPVGAAEQVFLRAIPGNLLTEDYEPTNARPLSQPCAQRDRQIGHLRERACAAPVDPVEELAATVDRLAMVGDKALHFLKAQPFEVDLVEHFLTEGMGKGGRRIYWPSCLIWRIASAAISLV